MTSHPYTWSNNATLSSILYANLHFYIYISSIWQSQKSVSPTRGPAAGFLLHVNHPCWYCNTYREALIRYGNVICDPQRNRSVQLPSDLSLKALTQCVSPTVGNKLVLLRVPGITWCYKMLPHNRKFSLSVPAAADAVSSRHWLSTVAFYEEDKAPTIYYFQDSLTRQLFFIYF